LRTPSCHGPGRRPSRACQARRKTRLGALGLRPHKAHKASPGPERTKKSVRPPPFSAVRLAPPAPNAPIHCRGPLRRPHRTPGPVPRARLHSFHSASVQPYLCAAAAGRVPRSPQRHGLGSAKDSRHQHCTAAVAHKPPRTAPLPGAATTGVPVPAALVTSASCKHHARTDYASTRPHGDVEFTAVSAPPRAQYEVRHRTNTTSHNRPSGLGAEAVVSQGFSHPPTSIIPLPPFRHPFQIAALCARVTPCSCASCHVAAQASEQKSLAAFMLGRMLWNWMCRSGRKTDFTMHAT
jgi:hypothetical protein